MKVLTEEQRDQVTDYLSRTDKECKNCGSKDWEIGEIDYFAADLILPHLVLIIPAHFASSNPNTQ